MSRLVTIVAVFGLALALSPAAAKAQWGYGGPYGIGAYGGYFPYDGYSPFGGYGFGPYAGFGPNGGLGYGPFHYSYSPRQLQQQAYLTQQVYQQQQQAIIDQLGAAQGRLEKLDTLKGQMVEKYRDLSESDKAAVQAGLVSDYLNLNARGREGWKRDAVIQALIGKELPRLDGVAEFRELSEPDKLEFRRAMLAKYRLLSAAEQRAWQSDQIVGLIMGREWWTR